jgi:hypothetical protein
MSQSGIAVLNALVSLYLVGRKPLYISTGRGVMDPLTGAGFSVTLDDIEKLLRKVCWTNRPINKPLERHNGSFSSADAQTNNHKPRIGRGRGKHSVFSWIISSSKALFEHSEAGGLGGTIKIQLKTLRFPLPRPIRGLWFYP